ncbi:S26 family signal peptidase [Plantactinospora sp. BC1]|uniref:S26 family signal peptidase n=1 Tax=Plantactinospora sp. BC1 TaxID=2108470 RepID=UPI001F34A54E|nr:S26 family signal peptidase [Plantactinospora sp. BC1]
MRTALAVCGLLIATGGWVGWLRARLVVVTVEGGSMEPTLHGRDRIVVRRTPARRLRVGQIVVLEQPRPGPRPGGPTSGGGIRGRRWMIKRLAALPGDPLPPGVTVDGGAASVPAGRVVVLGDNRDASTDSRTFGPVPLDQVLGVALRRYAGGGPIIAETPHRPAGSGPPAAA